MMRHDTCTDEARCQDWPLCRHRGFPLDEGDTGSTFWPGAPVAQDGPIDAPPGRYREAIGSFVGTVIALSATERERDELRAKVLRVAALADALEAIGGGSRATRDYPMIARQIREALS